MQSKTENLEHLIDLGIGYCGDQEDFSATLKHWRQKLGYCSIFAVVPAVLGSGLPELRSTQAKPSKKEIGALDTRRVKKLNTTSSSRTLLKQQTEFRLPHQQGGIDESSLLSALDNCPGQSIPGGTYTAAAPYVTSADTTSANNTVNYVLFDYGAWGSEWMVPGPDHIYAFQLTGRGANPQIQVSTSSNSYRPTIYILDTQNGCPASNASTRALWWLGAVQSIDGIATISAQDINFLPLNVPLYLLVDSIETDARGFGPYTLRMQDITIAPASCANANPIECTDFFVRQHYRDFLNREPDTPGLTFWNNDINFCGVDAQCIEVKRINVSASFFLSIEFQRTGYLVYKTYAAAFGPTRIGSTVPLTRSEFMPDTQRVGNGVVVGATGWETLLQANQIAYFNEFVQRPNFVATYPPTLANTEYVATLNANAGNVLSISERDQLVQDLNAGSKTRAEVLRAVVENDRFTDEHFNRAFVLMQYFGYLRRNPNDAPDHNFDGYNFWLNKLNAFNGNVIDAEMVKAFLTSTEYRQRFGP